MLISFKLIDIRKVKTLHKPEKCDIPFYSVIEERPINDKIKVLFTEIDYSKFVAPHKIKVISAKGDKALPYDYQTSCISNLKNMKNMSGLEQITMKGSHYNSIEHPKDVVKEILK